MPWCPACTDEKTISFHQNLAVQFTHLLNTSIRVHKKMYVFVFNLHAYHTVDHIFMKIQWNSEFHVIQILLKIRHKYFICGCTRQLLQYGNTFDQIDMLSKSSGEPHNFIKSWTDRELRRLNLTVDALLAGPAPREGDNDSSAAGPAYSAPCTALRTSRSGGLQDVEKTG